MKEINLKDFYSQSQVQDLLQMPHRMQIRRWLTENSDVYHIYLCGRPYFLRLSVDAYLAKLVKNGALNAFDIEKRKMKQVAYNISTSEWLPRCLAIQLFEQNSRRLYDKSQKRLFQLVRTKKVYGAKWFYKQDIIDFLTENLTIEEALAKHQAVDNTVKLNIEIPDRFFEN